MEPMHQRVAGIGVHGGFKRDMRALVAWLQTHRIQQVVMESTGIYWKSVFAHLEAASIPALVVNAFHVKTPRPWARSSPTFCSLRPTASRRLKLRSRRPGPL